MVERQITVIEEKLTNIPKGSLFVKKCSPAEPELSFLSEQFVSCSDGKGLVESYSVFPGISLLHNFYRANHYGFQHAPLGSVLQINHCRYGRVGWEMHDGLNIYLGPGDLSLHMMDACAESAMSLPLGYYEGIAISVDLAIFERQTVVSKILLSGETHCHACQRTNRPYLFRIICAAAPYADALF